MSFLANLKQRARSYLVPTGGGEAGLKVAR